MKTTPYRRGVRKEYELKKMLEKEGYTVYRTAGSHGNFDLIGLDNKKKRIIFAQVKYSKKPLFGEDVTTLDSLRELHRGFLTLTGFNILCNYVKNKGWKYKWIE